jgi:hypothetical protein
MKELDRLVFPLAMVLVGAEGYQYMITHKAELLIEYATKKS